MKVMPAIGQLRCVTGEKIAQIAGRVGRIVGHRPLQRMVRPAPAVFVVDDIVSEPREPDRILQVIPGDPADRVLRGHAGDDDPEPRPHGELLRRVISKEAGACLTTPARLGYSRWDKTSVEGAR